MKTFANQRPHSVDEAVSLAQAALADGRSVSFAGGGTDLLQLIKDRVANRPGSGAPDVLIDLKRIDGIDQVTTNGDGGVTVGGLTTLTALAEHDTVGSVFQVLAEAAESVASPQIRNTGTVAGNVCQRPWCWYYRNNFPCFKAGGSQCFSAAGEHQLHAIFGGGPSFIVHPSDVAPALVALDARFTIAGPQGQRSMSGEEFFVLPRNDAAHENVLADDEMLVSVEVPGPTNEIRSHYMKVMDRENWTHAVASAAVVLSMDGDVCRSAKIVLGGVAPIPWRVEAAEQVLNGQRITPQLAEAAGVAAVENATPLPKNAYKVPLTRRVVERAVLAAAERG